jgi:extracellular elastinolytic metalloproteinase
VGMGEGWSDYIACSLTGADVVGAWVVDRPDGIRAHRYDERFPDDFGDLGQGRYAPGGDEHAVGEIWCATLMSLNRKIGAPLAVRLVVEACKLSAANPSFLNMRDHILAAVDQLAVAGKLPRSRDKVHADVWEVFARYGMGRAARSNGAQLTGIVADYDVPDGVQP